MQVKALLLLVNLASCKQAVLSAFLIHGGLILLSSIWKVLGHVALESKLLEMALLFIAKITNRARVEQVAALAGNGTLEGLIKVLSSGIEKETSKVAMRYALKGVQALLRASSSVGLEIASAMQL